MSPAKEAKSEAEVVFRGQVSGTRDGAEWPPPGSKVKLPAEEAEQLIESKMAVDASDAAAVKALKARLGGGTTMTTAEEAR